MPLLENLFLCERFFPTFQKMLFVVDAKAVYLVELGVNSPLNFGEKFSKIDNVFSEGSIEYIGPQNNTIVYMLTEKIELTRCLIFTFSPCRR